MNRTVLTCSTLFLGLGILASTSYAELPALEGCGAADPSYIRTANETGGIPMFLLRSEAGKAFHLVRETTRTNVSTVFWGSGLLDAQRQTADIPVDSLTQRITFAISFAAEGSNVTIVPPRSPAIAQGSPDSEVTDLHCGRIVTVTRPEVGNWHVELTGKGRYWLEAQVQSELYTVNLDFVREGGRPGHEGLFQIEGQPVAGKPATIRAVLSEHGTRTQEFYFANERGETIRQLPLRPVSGSGGEFLGTADLPDVPFRVAVRGVDANGKDYQRFFAPLHHAESVEVSWNRAFDELPAGSTKQAQFTIRNSSFSRSFKVTVTDAHHFVVRAEPQTLTLGPAQSGTLVVDLAVPAGTAPGTGDDVVVVVASSDSPETSNSSVAHFSVTR
jgi:hypothetical protein